MSDPLSRLRGFDGRLDRVLDGHVERFGDLRRGREGTGGAHDRSDRDEHVLRQFERDADLSGRTDVQQVGVRRRVNRDQRGEADDDQRDRIQFARATDTAVMSARVSSTGWTTIGILILLRRRVAETFRWGYVRGGRVTRRG